MDYSGMPDAYVRHVTEMVDQYGWNETDSGIRVIKSSPMAGDAIMWYAAAVEEAGTFDSDAVKAVMEKMTIDQQLTASGQDLIGGEDHNTYRDGSLYCYTWQKNDEGMWYYEEVKVD